MLSAAFLIILFLTPADGRDYKYFSKGKRDPFMPLVTGEMRTSLGLEAVEDIDDIRCEGVIFDPGAKSMVVLNDEVLKEGDKVNNVEVIKIGKDLVIIKIREKEHTIKLTEEGGEES